MEDDPDLPGFDAEAARAWLDGLETQAAAAFRPRPAERLDLHAGALELRRLLASAPPDLPTAALTRLWREFEGVRRRTFLRIAVWGGSQPDLTAALARRRFGASPRLAFVREPAQAVAAAEAEGVVAVVALEGAWWGRLLARPQVRVFSALHGEVDLRKPLALALTAEPIDATGGDVSFWVTDAAAPNAVIEAKLGEAGFVADLVAEAGGLKLFALAGYVQPHDARLAQAPGRLLGVIGAAPIGLDP